MRSRCACGDELGDAGRPSQLEDARIGGVDADLRQLACREARLLVDGFSGAGAKGGCVRCGFCACTRRSSARGEVALALRVEARRAPRLHGLVDFGEAVTRSAAIGRRRSSGREVQRDDSAMFGRVSRGRAAGRLGRLVPGCRWLVDSGSVTARRRRARPVLELPKYDGKFFGERLVLPVSFGAIARAKSGERHARQHVRSKP